eukprot:s170_g32.t1
MAQGPLSKANLQWTSLFLRCGDRAGQGATHQALSDLARLDGDSDQGFQAGVRRPKGPKGPRMIPWFHWF